MCVPGPCGEDSAETLTMDASDCHCLRSCLPQRLRSFAFSFCSSFGTTSNQKPTARLVKFHPCLCTSIYLAISSFLSDKERAAPTRNTCGHNPTVAKNVDVASFDREQCLQPRCSTVNTPSQWRFSDFDQNICALLHKNNNTKHLHFKELFSRDVMFKEFMKSNTQPS